jgi:hypothetical protein
MYAPRTLESWHPVSRPGSLWILARSIPVYGEEIDLLIDLDNTLYPLEIKKTASPRKEVLRHFGALERLGRTIGPGGLVCMVKTVLPVTKEVNAIPVWAI